MNNPFYSQFGEDAFMAEIFEGKANGTCLEVGALDGIKDSITLHFEKKGWACILVEANPELAQKAKTNRRAQVFSCAAGRESGAVDFVIARGAEYLSTMMATEAQIARMVKDGATIERVTVPVRRIDDILQQAGIPSLDFATIDVEGAELEVLQGFDLNRWNPKVVVVEDNTGGRDIGVRRHLYSKGYRRFHYDGLNDWYAKKDDKRLVTAARSFADVRRRIRTRLYQGTISLLPANIQGKLVKWKRKWLKRF